MYQGTFSDYHSTIYGNQDVRDFTLPTFGGWTNDIKTYPGIFFVGYPVRLGEVGLGSRTNYELVNFRIIITYTSQRLKKTHADVVPVVYSREDPTRVYSRIGTTRS